VADKSDNVEHYVKIVGIAVTVGTFAIGVWQFNANETSKREDRFLADNAQIEQRQAAARQPYLDRQLQLYTEAGRSAATLASSSDPKALADARERFWQLYFGDLAMVEDQDVDSAMKEFGDALANHASQGDLQMCSLRLSHRLRRSIETAWGTKLWASPYGTEPECTYPGSDAR
jgi:hypothetical protein